jgi:amidase/aspartyl-tRNA(Asn)/glutamyl-tRNA(Gln) amidotransferase subunit A
MPDYGLLASGVSSAHGVTRNPWDLRMNTGGSSSGAASSVAAGAGALSIGSDLGGSVRLPAAQCGLFGHKPTIGLVPHLPVSTARVAGPLTRTVADGALLLSVISRPDARTGEPAGPTPVRVEPLGPGGLKLGLLLDMGFGPDVEPEVAQLIERAARRLEAEGASLTAMAPPVDVDLNPVFDQIFSVRAAMERDELPPDRSRDALDVINRTCDAGERLSAKAYLRGRLRRRAVAVRFRTRAGVADGGICSGCGRRRSRTSHMACQFHQPDQSDRLAGGVDLLRLHEGGPPRWPASYRGEASGRGDPRARGDL